MIELGNGTNSLAHRLQQLEDESTILETEIITLKKRNILFTED